MITPLDLIKIAFTAWITWDFLRYARSGKARRHLTVFAGRSVLEWFKAIGLVFLNLIVVLGLILWLYSLGNPVLNFSWLLLFATPADGPDPSTNLVAAGTQFPWFGFFFGLLLALNMPRLARREEEVFRRGTSDWKDGATRSVKFGLVHMIVGVPLCAAFALMVAGLFFTWRYFSGGIREASFYHALHNLGVLSLVGAYYLLS